MKSSGGRCGREESRRSGRWAALGRHYAVKQDLTSSAVHSRAHTQVNLALTPGTRLGVYEVIAGIGVGGMGEVFRARDTKLDRDVALKVLPDSFSSDPGRLARFTRVAQTLASRTIRSGGS